MTAADALIDWTLRRATADDDGPALIDGFCQALCAAGLPLWRMNVATPTIDPSHRAVSFNWRRGFGVSVSVTAHGAYGEAIYRHSPIAMLLEQERTQARWRIEMGEGCEAFPLLAELRADGGADYLLHLVGFSPGTALLGAAISFTTERPGGFTPDEEAHLGRFLPALGLAAYRLNLSRTVRELLGAYLGPMTAGRVLAGGVRRGEGEVLPAALLLADLRGFTALADREDPRRVVAWLDEHMEALGASVAAQGGEILKFTGDGFLAAFPARDADLHPCPVCARALAAAEGAVAENDALNARRRAAGAPELPADLVLHFGDVVYGNIGTAQRLDFTTIGRAVNEASRIEALCEKLGRPLLLSDSFARRCGRTLLHLGDFPLRGIGGTRQLWTV